MEPTDEVVFGRYRLRSLLGQGGMGKVYKARDTLIDRDVAVKVLPVELSAESGYRERFRREAHTAARLAEPHVIPIYDTGEIDGQLYLVMPVVDGVDAHRLLKRDGAMTPKRAVRVVEQLASALDAAHAAGLVHRDVKPSNALLTGRDDFVYLIDFGIAHDARSPKLTTTGTLIGSWAYMAPERFTARPAGASADIYSLACVLYECLTGAQPYPGNSIEQQFAGHFSQDPPVPGAVNPTVPSGFDAVIARGMAKDPDERYSTAYDLAEAARAALNTAPASAPHAAFTMVDLSQPPVPTELASTGPSPEPNPPGLTTPYGSRPAPQPAARARPTPPPVPARPPLITPPPAAPPPPAAGSAEMQRRPVPPPPRRTRRPLVITGAVLLTAVAITVGAVLLQPRTTPGPNRAPAAQSEVPAAQPEAPAAQSPQAEAPDGAQDELAIPGLTDARGLAVDGTGNVFVTDTAGGGRVLELTAGSGGPTTLPFTGLNNPSGLALDGSGAVYVADAGSGQVLKVAAGSSLTTQLPFAGLNELRGVAVDSAGNVFVLAGTTVRKLAAGSTNTTEPPFQGLAAPAGLAVDGSGAVYVADTGNDRVLRLGPGDAAPTVLPFAGLKEPRGVAVDGGGAVYVADTGNARVLRLATGAAEPTVVAFTGLSAPGAVAVGGTGQVAVVDGGSRVLTLVAG